MTVDETRAAPRVRAAAEPSGLHEPVIERIEYGAVATAHRGRRVESRTTTGQHPIVSIIVPTLDGNRRGLLAQLIDSLELQTLVCFELLLVIGDRRQGRAINRGVAAARAGIIVTMDDDTVIGTPKLLEILVDVLANHPDVGMAGASTVVPPGAGWLQRVASRQIPRRLFPVTDTLIDSDMVQHPCLAMRKRDFERMGGEDEQLIRGLDPLLRFKVRSAGLRVVIAPHCYVSHPLPDRLAAILRMYYRNGKGSAFAQRHYPDRIYPLDDGFHGNRFPSKVPFARRIVRYPLRLLHSCCTGRWVRLAVELSYACGYATEWFLGTRPARTATPAPAAQASAGGGSA